MEVEISFGGCAPKTIVMNHQLLIEQVEDLDALIAQDTKLVRTIIY